nr:hypothetical protein B0A51_13873 [Rachicladosporium sp. CCFEE 5018]
MFSLLPIPSSPPPSLLTLPPELRLQIFALALSPYPKTLVTFHLDPYQREDYVEATQPALTRVSRQLRAEALPLFYQQNSFVLHSEGKKGDERERWFRGMGIWVEELRTLEIWVRFWKRGGDGRGGGIVGVGLKWEGGRWRVGEAWRWSPHYDQYLPGVRLQKPGHRMLSKAGLNSPRADPAWKAEQVLTRSDQTIFAPESQESSMLGSTRLWIDPTCHYNEYITSCGVARHQLKQLLVSQQLRESKFSLATDSKAA